jgi:hypothetical protein
MLATPEISGIRWVARGCSRAIAFMNSLKMSIEHVMDNAQARLGCAVYEEQYFRAGGALTSDYGFILLWKDY